MACQQSIAVAVATRWHCTTSSKYQQNLLCHQATREMATKTQKKGVAVADTFVASASFGRVVKVKFGAAEVPLTTRVTFKVVGIELGAKERVASLAHFAPRLQKTLHSGKRLLSLEVPAGVAVFQKCR